MSGLVGYSSAVLLLLLAVACDDPSPTQLIGEVWFGDPHAHTGVSGDGCSSDIGPDPRPYCGALADAAGIAEQNGLDWFVTADHTNGVNARADVDAEADWAEGIANTQKGGPVVALAGAEVFLTAAAQDPEAADLPLGHRTVIFFGEGLEALGRAAASPTGTLETRVECSGVQTWVDGLRASFGDVVLIPHHPAARSPMPTDWGCVTDADLGVELYSHWGNSRSWLSPEAPWADFDPLRGGAESVTVREGTVDYALARHPALQLGFLAGTDDHTNHPGSVCAPVEDSRYGGGLTAVVAPLDTPLTRDALYEGLVARHTYATSGPRVPLRVTVSTGSGSTAGMGDVLDLDGATEVTVHLTVGAHEIWDDDVLIVNAIQPGDTDLDERKTQLHRVTGGEYEATVPVGPSTDTRSQFVFLEIVLDGLDAHPADCADDANEDEPDDTERIWTSPTWF